MRLLELILLLACAAVSIRLAAVGRAAGITWIHAMQLLLAVALIAQILLEGWRWQMFPAYAAAVLVATTPGLLGLGALATACAAIATFGLLAASLVSCLALPFVAPQKPHGPFAVGVTALPVNIQRPADAEPYEMKGVPQVRLWYPAQAPGWSSRFNTALAERIANRFHAVPTLPATAAAPAAQAGKKFPVVIYFDGWPEDKTQNVNLILELASRGYAVASVIYPGIDRPLGDYSSDAAFEHSVQLDHARVRLHARDAIAILDELASLDARTDSNFKQRLDSQHASTVGFSFGGAVAAEATRLDPRIRAAVNLDGRHWGDALEHGVAKPYLFICEELIVPTAADLASSDPAIRYEARMDRIDYSQLAANQQANGGIRVTIPGVAHMNFTDIALRSPLRRFSFGGTIDAYRAQLIINTFVIEFLARYGGEAHGPLPAFDSAWPRFAEARLETWPAPTPRP